MEEVLLHVQAGRLSTPFRCTLVACSLHGLPIHTHPVHSTPVHSPASVPSRGAPEEAPSLHEPATAAQSSLGAQLHSRKATAPTYTMARRYGPNATAPLVANQTGGPGSHGTEQHMESAFSAQARSHRANAASARFGNEGRFGTSPKSARNCTTSPGSLLPRHTQGWLGEHAPKFSFSGSAKRCSSSTILLCTPTLVPPALASPSLQAGLLWHRGARAT